MSVRKPEHHRHLRTLGRHLARHRCAAGLSQNEVSFACGVSQANISRVERGESDFFVWTLFRCIDALGITPAEFFADYDQPPALESFGLEKAA